jgi:hypothetical protein
MLQLIFISFLILLRILIAISLHRSLCFVTNVLSFNIYTTSSHNRLILCVGLALIDLDRPIASTSSVGEVLLLDVSGPRSRSRPLFSCSYYPPESIPHP